MKTKLGHWNTEGILTGLAPLGTPSPVFGKWSGNQLFLLSNHLKAFSSWLIKLVWQYILYFSTKFIVCISFDLFFNQDERLLIVLNNCQYVRINVLPKLVDSFRNNDYPISDKLKKVI